MGTLLGIISLIASAIGAGASIKKSSDINKALGAKNEQEIDIKNKRDREMRRAALSRAIGSKNVFAPNPEPLPIQPPDTSTLDAVGGVADVVGQTASSWQTDKPEWMTALGRAVDKQKTINAVGGGTY